MKKISSSAIVVAIVAWFSVGAALAQTSPNLTFGQVLTPAQWNQLFINKNDTLGYRPLNSAGGVLSGPLITVAPTSIQAGFNLPPGTAPGSPNNGDLWAVSGGGLFFQNNGVTVPILTSGGGSASIAIASTIVNGGAGILYNTTSGGALTALAAVNNAVLSFNGSGTFQASTTLPSGISATNINLTTPTLGVASATSLALGGATIGSNALAVTGTTLHTGIVTISSNSTSALAVGANGATNPQLLINAATGSAATGFSVTGAAAGGGVALAAISSGTNENASLNAKGSGVINIGSVSTGGVVLAAGGGGVTITGSLTATGLVTNADLATMAAWTIKLNNTSGIASPTDVTIDQLTLKASPISADEVMIWDSVALAMKKATAGSIGSVGAVASLNGQTGTVTLLTEAFGRLTLQANTPVMTASQTGATTLRYDCYLGNQVPYYTGSIDAIDTISSCEVIDAMVSAASAGQVVSGQIYDVWWVHSGANRICLAMSSATGGGGGWASDTGGSNTARGTGYSQLDRVTRPYTTNKNSIANCFNGSTNYGSVSANQATFLGTVLASANGQISWTFGSVASGGVAGVFGVWNMYHRATVSSMVADSTASWNYALTQVRGADGSATMRFTYVMGIAEDSQDTNYKAIGNGTAGTVGALAGICHDVTNAFASNSMIGDTSNSNTSNIDGRFVSLDLGSHFVNACEAASAASTVTYIGTTAFGAQSGMFFQAKM